jgi:hypothetical protein
VVIHGWSDAWQIWIASRDGEPSFRGVQGLGDAYMASARSDAKLIISDDVYAAMVRAGHAPPERPKWAFKPAG